MLNKIIKVIKLLVIIYKKIDKLTTEAHKTYKKWLKAKSLKSEENLQ